MTDRPTQLLICVNRRYGVDKPSCAMRGSLALVEAIEKGIAERRIDIAVERIICLGQCTKGPSMRLAPGGDFILGDEARKVPEILERIERLCGRKAAAPDAETPPPTPPAHLLGS